MKFLRFDSLGTRLFVICAAGIAASALPAFFYFCELSGRARNSECELGGVKMLSSLAVVAHSAYLSGADERFDASELKKAVKKLSDGAPKLGNSDAKKSPRIQGIFSASSIDAFVKTPDTGDIVADMGGFIALQSGLFTDSHTGVHMFMDASSDLFPSFYSALFKFSSLLKKYPAAPDRVQASEFSAAYVVLNERATELVAELRRACAICPPEKSVSIVADIGKFNSATIELNSAVSKIWHGKSLDASLVRTNLTQTEKAASELWNVSVKSLDGLLTASKNADVSKLRIAGYVFAGVVALSLFVSLLAGRSVALSARRTRRLAALAALRDIQGAREYFEITPRRISAFAGIDTDIVKLLDAYAEISEIAKTVLDSSVQLDEDARSIVAEQKPRLNGVSNGLLRIDAKTNLRDKSDASLAVAAQNLRESLNGAEQLARSQEKSVQEVSGGIRGALSSAQGIVSRLAALRGAAAKMSVIAETFTGVADQANILSLNLSIETAKSGIKGSGLGTLAEQVKILSKRTVVSVIDIESIRDSILETLDAGANDTDSFLSALESDSKILDEIDAALSELTLMLSKISAETNGISASLRGRAGSDSTVQEAMENLARVDAALSEFTAFSKNAVSFVNRARERLAVGSGR